MEKINSIISNNFILNHEKYAAILGESPSKGARSPILWNRAFKKLNLNAEMVPLDIAEDNLSKVLSFLQNDKYFIGGAVAVPYKEKVFNWLKKYGSLSEEANNIGAVNCLYRDKNNHLKGTNTDGEAGKSSLLRNYGSISNKNILLIGYGGAGKALLAFLEKEVLPNGKIYCLTRQKGINKEYANVKFINSTQVNQNFHKFDILINCTSIGFGEKINDSPIHLDKLNYNKNLFIFDIIYQPLETKLLKISKSLGLRTLNGLEMNLEQAVLAFGYASKNDSQGFKDNVKIAMSK